MSGLVAAAELEGVLRRLQAVRVEPEDVIVATIAREPVDDEELSRFARILGHTFPHNKVAILAPGTTLKMYRPIKEED